MFVNEGKVAANHSTCFYFTTIQHLKLVTLNLLYIYYVHVSCMPFRHWPFWVDVTLLVTALSAEREYVAILAAEIHNRIRDVKSCSIEGDERDGVLTRFTVILTASTASFSCRNLSETDIMYLSNPNIATCFFLYLPFSHSKNTVYIKISRGSILWISFSNKNWAKIIYHE